MVDIATSPGITSVDVTVSQAIRVQGVTCEVQQLLGEGTIRCVAMEATEGLKRGEPAIGLGGPTKSLLAGDLWTGGVKSPRKYGIQSIARPQLTSTWIPPVPSLRQALKSWILVART